MTKDDGGMAFPRPYSLMLDGVQVWPSDGMSLRDYFAAKAMQALVERLDSPEIRTVMDREAQTAYSIADAMIAARMASHDGA